MLYNGFYSNDAGENCKRGVILSTTVIVECKKLGGKSYAHCSTQVRTFRVASACVVWCVGCRYRLFLYKHTVACTDLDLLVCLCIDTCFGIIHGGNFFLCCAAAGGDNRFMAAFYGAITMHHIARACCTIVPFYPLASALRVGGALCRDSVRALLGLSHGASFGSPVDDHLFSCNTYCNKNIVIDSIDPSTAGQSRVGRVKACYMRKVRTPCE